MWLCCKLTVIALTVAYCATILPVNGADIDIGNPARCTEKYCEDLETECSKLPPNCTVSKPGFFGWETDSPTICNCCPFCIAYLVENEICAVGQAIGIVPTHVCGPGLYCYTSDEKAVKARCKKMTHVVESYKAIIAITTTPAPNKPANGVPAPEFYMKCSEDQLDYDKKENAGELGNLQLRPECDDDGFYASYKCVPGEICYCQDEYGDRIFGEMPFTQLAHIVMHCSCSRHNAKAARQFDVQSLKGNIWSQTRCLSDGSYDPLQCLEEGCLCVDRVDGVPTYPKAELVNITTIEQKTIDCFDNKTHKEFDYYNACEDIYNRDFQEDLEFYVNDFDTYGSSYPNCQMDGYYERVQKSETEFFCAYPNGTKIEGYGIPLNDPSAKKMNCNCARTNLIIADIEKPECCPNGNYKKMQCRRGECRCVDINGNQNVQEVPMDEAENLECYTNSCVF